MIQEEVLSTAINHSTLSILSFGIYILDAKKIASACGRKHLAEISPPPPTVNVVVILTLSKTYVLTVLAQFDLRNLGLLCICRQMLTWQIFVSVAP